MNYGDPVLTGGALALDAQMIAAANAHGAFIADGFGAWAPVAATAGGDSCAAGLLIRTSASTCDVHPSQLGRDLLAQAVVDAITLSCPALDPSGCLNTNRA